MTSKEELANTLADTVYLGMNACERFGMTWGCQIDCPVLQAGKCELKDTDNKELYQEFLNQATNDTENSDTNPS